MLKLSENPPMLHPRVESLAQINGTWWVAHTNPRNEKALAWDLADRDITYFLPMIQRTTFSGGRKRRGMMPLFSSYLFICGDEQTRYAVLRTDRVCNLIEVRDQQQLKTELTAIERVLATNTPLTPCALPRIDDTVEVTKGPFRGIIGTVVRRQGVAHLVLTVSILGRGVEMEIEGDLLEIVAPRRASVP